ncbi:MAG: hypothetical protein GWO24_35685 [Akkermansiaceae bacterium]|nr:hypothetical protein [Akkermansiaceae bacterium]
MPDSSTSPLSASRQEGTLLLGLSGEWDIREDPPGFELLAPEFHNGNTPGKVTFDTHWGCMTPA